jgi:hypothetical protein
MLHWQEANSRFAAMSPPTKRRRRLYLLSDLASGVTGEIHYVDAGYNNIGMKLLDDDTRSPRRAGAVPCHGGCRAARLDPRVARAAPDEGSV